MSRGRKSILSIKVGVPASAGQALVYRLQPAKYWNIGSSRHIQVRVYAFATNFPNLSPIHSRRSSNAPMDLGLVDLTGLPLGKVPILTRSFKSQG